ncbi:MAG: hypothetical protein WB424_10020 [Terracidiphilus sp.]
MREDSLLPPNRQCLPFSEFLSALFHAFTEAGLRYCVLRNYEGFPAHNQGRDIDFMIFPQDLRRALVALKSVQDVRIIGYAERPFVALVYLDGIAERANDRELETDFDLGLTWNGLPFLTTEAVLQAVIPYRADGLDFFVPSPACEAIVKLLSSLIVAGVIKEKYFSQVQRVFADDRQGVMDALAPQFTLKTATRLVDAVIDGDRQKILGCVRELRVSLALQSLLHHPFQSVAKIAGHYSSGFMARLSPRNQETVCILGPRGCGKTALIEGLLPMLHSAAHLVEGRQFISRSTLGDELPEEVAETEFKTKGFGHTLASMAKIAPLLLREWKGQFLGKMTLSLSLCESYSCDLWIDPPSCYTGLPRWYAKLAGKLFPSPDLWILLDPFGEGCQSREGKTPSAQALKQMEAYRRFVRTREKYVILDASQPGAHRTKEAYEAIVKMLEERAGHELEKRFAFRAEARPAEIRERLANQ